MFLLLLVAQDEPALAVPDEWERRLTALRAGVPEDPSTPEGRAFEEIRQAGPAGYPFLIRYIDSEDPLLGRAAVAILNRLTGKTSPLPNDANKAGLRAEWEFWLVESRAVASKAEDVLPLLLCRRSEADVKTLLDQLSADSPKDRAAAKTALSDAVLAYEELFREAYADRKDHETRSALWAFLEPLDGRRRRILELAQDPRWLVSTLNRLRTEAPDPAAFGERTARLLDGIERCRAFFRSVEARKRRIERECGLDRPGSARWAQAFAAWRDFQKEPGLPVEARDGAEREIEALNGRAVRAADATRREALALLESGRRAEAVRVLREALQRQGGLNGVVELHQLLNALRP